MRKPAFQICVELLSRFSLHSQYRIGDFISFVVRNTPNQISKQTRANIKLCFPDLERSEQQQLYREAIRHTCYTMTELAAVWCWPVDKILPHIKSMDICDSFNSNARAKIILAPHLGSWELLATWLGQVRAAVMLYKRRKNRALDDFIKQARARSGGSLVPTKKHGLRKLLVGLKDGATLMILPDQKPAKNKARIDAKLFGISAPTTTLVQNLCSKIDCDVYIATVYRSSPPGEFSLRIQPLQQELLAADEASSAQYMNDQIEQLARQQLEQYQWGYRRFATSAYKSVK